MKRAYLLHSIVVMAFTSCVFAQGTEWRLPNLPKTLEFVLQLNNGVLTYHVEAVQKDSNAVSIVEESPMGITRKDQDFTSGLTFVSESDITTIDETYSMLIGKKSMIRNNGIEKTFTFANQNGAKLQVIVRAYADGVAFRYRFPEQSGYLHCVTGESTGFKLPMGGKAWLLPYSKLATWAPAYEAEWQNNVSIGTPSPEDVGWALPALFNTAGHWIMVTEADATPDFYVAHLEQQCKNGLYSVRLPEENETCGVAPREAYSILPWVTPWRVLIIGETPAAIVESNLVYNLSRPSVLDDVSWIKPGRVSWSWWSDQQSPSNYKKLVPFVDLSAELGWEYSLIDLGWHHMTNGGDIRKLVDYAKTKNVGIIIWYNSGGKHNEVNDAGPRDIMCDPVKRVQEMKKLQEWGIKGVKVDFMQSDKQYLMGLYEDILRDAAHYHLLVDFHGATIPRGWSRTYPNMLTIEAIRGAEQYWDINFAENAHTFHTIYAFTRNVVGPMDYTPVIFNDPPDKQKHKTTYAHELALSVIFESGLQHFVDTPASYLSQPAYVVDFLKVVPVTWDETRYLDGTPGDMVIMARRKGNDWYVAGLNGKKEERTAAVSLAFLGDDEYNASVILDGSDPNSFAQQQKKVSKTDTLPVKMLGRGGFAGRITKP